MNHPDGSVRRHFSLFNGVSRFPDSHIASPVRTFHRRRVPLTRFSSTAAAATHNVHRRQSVVRGAGRPPRLAPRRVALAGVRRRRSAQAFRRFPVLRREVSVLLHASCLAHDGTAVPVSPARPSPARLTSSVRQTTSARPSTRDALHRSRRSTKKKERKKEDGFFPSRVGDDDGHPESARVVRRRLAPVGRLEQNTTCRSRRRDTSHSND